ncbi:Endothelin-converting enzyme 1 [Gordonia bronchialis DSM 43247]|uniref:Endothelin-converting enzyme 1 n=1 Tax=Gordonia bronchialis (strain ATCC 25592 / DSM 43247 / BCRC 13721 / JCM 3198 / KCTC 3076 / NBRC 16047 / NCTC 10667) TaxID=526226 RepID=D0L2I8_GORB4|nr:M13-type metalloendopeptidase [Gordonia bronchialis]ACY22891.1 Endothelin-converting enzyme 1 [Gordonia bronchialis DSM 43247]MCC3325670.1 twin-arginine translocation signal domain-containing protein [Gordonia bronchialis]QGS23670.1 M13 family peptidase [Gordonia bronchialis]STQ65838.1 Neutral endopeptidase [Gordonia bronchialis]
MSVKSSSGRRAHLSRRSFLLAAGAVPIAVALAGCESESAPKPLAGPDLSGLDPTIRPQDDLYRNVNGTWLRTFQLPPDKSYYGTFSEVSDRVQQQLRTVIDDIHDPEPGTDAQQICDLYDARLDEATLDRLGISPLQPLFSQIDGARTKPDIARVMGSLPLGGMIGLSLGIDRNDSNAYLPNISQSGLNMGDPQYYLKPDFAQYLSAYHTFLRKLANGAGLPAGAADRALALEKRMAPAFWDNVRERDADATYNPMSWNQLTALGPGFDWEPWLAGTTDRPKELFATVVVNEPSYVTAAATIWRETDIRTLGEWLKLSLLVKYARFLQQSLRDANFEYVKTTSGITERPERWKSAVNLVDDNLGQQLGKLYVAQYFPSKAKDQAKELVDNLMAAYRDNFADSSWMSPETRRAAIAKLDKITVKIGYPDNWIDYSGLTITRGHLVESLLAVEAFEAKRAMDKLGKPVDKTEWGMSPQTVNAYYSAPSNSINFPAAILQAPFFDTNAVPAVNYGAIGATIGHEIGHGFDDQGSKYNGDGNRQDWWTPQDKAAFEAKTKQLIAQYNVLVPEGLPPTAHVNGAYTVGENLADLRGLMISLAAYRIAEAKAGNKTPDDTAVFQSWARNWREKQTTQTLEQQLASDPHSPGEFRCNQVVRNLPEFYATFRVAQADKMFLAPDQRVTL